jgi:ribonuclease HI
MAPRMRSRAPKPAPILLIMIKKLLLRFHNKLKTKSVKLYWIPSHVGIRGNEKVDALAKQ